MSTINAIMAELQAGEAAKARVPELETQVEQLKHMLGVSQSHVQAIELRAKERDETISMLTQKVSRLTEERDDASFRVLEAEDKLATFAKAVGNAWGGIGNALNAVNPPKVAEPVAEVKVEPSPLPVAAEPASQSQPALSQTASTGASASTERSEGQSDPRPSSAGTVEAASGPVPATEWPGVSQAQPWSPKVEMPEVKAEADEWWPATL